MKVVLDACVLFPSVLREILIGVAARGGYEPLWSARILGEWQRAASRLGAEAAAIATGEIVRLRSQWARAEIPADMKLEVRLWLPDPADAHVLATAISAQADRIVTLNLKDFPARTLASEGLRAQSPDDFLMEMWLSAHDIVEAAVREAQHATEAASGRAQPVRPLLKRAKLPRLGKALGSEG
ncbi:RSP_2648 family PIN domain-containing protein [Roseinatronobacter bogoriensis]|uniref:PIN domain-containing protein n=1 Tax=Roseinatronobacter bogoriensis subsp. barguzinensis TaxID=441209 RepID=A0A2K8K957_9RHOB|nr:MULTISPECIES: PIN domain-containing protein [Rhodobaca]ATX65982.1 PIN domain-containing protein [Rhodobaca barguzinensis]MBB4208025.1 putative nucleic acid-binding protein [Rhodobaca bogoriensis DSM 18756]TDW38664.1 putative nucleic acid-binding protein [Rhodobaca barguzinensis]TDY69297.1 putative nucleic acid-binding protein [Rhodobaca bogoriensis DSM 18756]